MNFKTVSHEFSVYARDNPVDAKLQCIMYAMLSLYYSVR